MHPFHIVGSVLAVVFGYAAIAIVQYLARLQKVTEAPLNLRILNLRARKFAEAETSYFENLKSILQAGYQEYKHGFYQLFSPTGYLVIASADFVEEMSRLPEGMLDFHGASQKRMIGDYTWLQIADDLLAYTIRTNVTRELGDLLPTIFQEIDYCIETNFPRSQDWTSLPIQSLAPRLIAIVIGHVLIGPELNRDEEWVNSVTQFVSDVYVGGLKLKAYNHVSRPFAARFLIHEIRRVWSHQATARRKLVPLLRARSVVQSSPDHRQNLDLLQWLLNNNADWPRPRSLDELAELASVAYVGATSTVATTLTNLLLDMAARPNDVEVMREEIAATSLVNMRQIFSIKNTSKLDSYMKESQRLNPAHLMTFSRIVRKPFTLSNGMTLPAGAHLIIPASMISLDGQFYSSPEDFQGFRFSDCRAQHSNNAYKHQFTTTTPRAMHFGYGRNACPGRFLASTIIKTFAASILTRFDLTIAEERPKCTALGSRNSPPRNAEILLRRRSS